MHSWHWVAAQQRSMKRADDIRDQIVGLMDRTEVPIVSNLGDHDRIKKAIAAGFFYNTANLQKNGGYRTVKNPQTVHIHPSSGMAEVNHSLCLMQPCLDAEILSLAPSRALRLLRYEVQVCRPLMAWRLPSAHLSCIRLGQIHFCDGYA